MSSTIAVGYGIEKSVVLDQTKIFILLEIYSVIIKLAKVSCIINQSLKSERKNGGESEVDVC